MITFFLALQSLLILFISFLLINEGINLMYDNTHFMGQLYFSIGSYILLICLLVYVLFNNIKKGFCFMDRCFKISKSSFS